jgi:phospholipid/cholesterol/gamma-HCH transport system ATP-binding protein
MTAQGNSVEPGHPVIEVRHIHTRFGAAVVHEDVSLTINRGEVFAIAGGNGTGKSVLMREIILLQTPTAGEIMLFGQSVRTMAEADVATLRRRCGVLFQHGALFSSLTVTENVMVPLREYTHLAKIDQGAGSAESPAPVFRWRALANIRMS